MNKKVLEEYIDACALIRETENDITRLEKKKSTIVTGSVKGSCAEFPYTEQHFHIEGIPFTYVDDAQLRIERKLLEERKDSAQRIKIQAEEFIKDAPVRIQRIIRFRYFEHLSWEQTAVRMGKTLSADSVRKEFDRFLEQR